MACAAHETSNVAFVNIVHADVKILPEGGKAVVALAGASVVRRDEARGRRATRVRAGRSAAEHRASLRAGTFQRENVSIGVPDDRKLLTTNKHENVQDAREDED